MCIVVTVIALILIHAPVDTRCAKYRKFAAVVLVKLKISVRELFNLIKLQCLVANVLNVTVSEAHWYQWLDLILLLLKSPTLHHRIAINRRTTLC